LYSNNSFQLKPFIRNNFQMNTKLHHPCTMNMARGTGRQLKGLHLMLLIAVSAFLHVRVLLQIDQGHVRVELTSTLWCEASCRNSSISNEKKPRASRRWSHDIVRDHPHAGARDENGTWPYIPDVTAIRRTVLARIQEQSIDPKHYLPLLDTESTVCQDAPGAGFEGPSGYKVLREYVELDGPDPLPQGTAPVDERPSSTRDGHWQRYQRHGSAASSTSGESPRLPPRILCGLKTHAANHHLVAHVADTWGWRCDGFFAASSKTQRDIGAVNLLHKGKEEYNNLWQKVRSMMAFMYDNYLDDYDYFLLADDDTFIVLENLRNYLLSLESATGGRDARPLYIGSPVVNGDTYYHTGGPGYVLNRSALRFLVEDGLPYYFAYLTNVRAPEDYHLGAIMTVLHIPIVDTSDASNRERFFDDLGTLGDDQQPKNSDLLMYRRGNRKGRDFVSTQSIGFHGIKSMKRFSAILYNACPRGTVLGDAQNSTVGKSLRSIRAM
jgi:hypothetical protein